ncbi:MAG: YbaB/EbfC family nucleoid-associated protein [Clostridia bacterium]|nr:YbaB/EbfC family nucleoid-associated protein [Clostridia bacterium]MBR0509363.1 YbaB/EbfC family nucleoid-associated protein [Clostridia bacterium]MBR0537289.1 YbaB/EbfC family nucleoid-associated protein [Clostridia bacterium]
MKARIPNQGGSRNDMMAKIQKMQDDMAAAQADVESREFEAEAGGGCVKVTVNGKHELQSIKISPDVVDPEDVEMLEDFITIAFNEAIRKANATMESEMGKLTGGLNIPGLSF